MRARVVSLLSLLSNPDPPISASLVMHDAVRAEMGGVWIRARQMTIFTKINKRIKILSSRKGLFPGDGRT